MVLLIFYMIFQLIFQEKPMTKYLIYFNLLFLSTLYASDMVKVKIKSGHIGRGEWIGTYSGHIHLLIEDKVYYYACDEILSVMVDDKTNIEEAFVFDCSENTFPLTFFSHLRLIP